jgi:Cdc6-like AAA superfamily ATPase
MKDIEMFIGSYLCKTLLLALFATSIFYVLLLFPILRIPADFTHSLDIFSQSIISLLGGFIIAVILHDVKAAGQIFPTRKLTQNQRLLCFLCLMPLPIFLLVAYFISLEVGIVTIATKCIFISSLLLLVIVSQLFKQLWRVQHAVIMSLCFLVFWIPIDILEFLFFSESGAEHLKTFLCWLIFMTAGLGIGYKLKQSKQTIKAKPSKDSYERESHVTRIVQKLCEYQGNIALIGAFGSGKTWITEQVISNVEDKYKDWVTVKIDGWGVQESAMSQSIISHIIKEISLRADMVAYIGLPNNYRDALQGAGSVTGILNSLTNSGLEYVEQFGQINCLLNTLKLNLLVVVEDIDRNKNAAVLANEVSNLLDQLSSIQKIRFIFSVGYESHFSAMLMKSCGFSEFIPAPNFADTKANLLKLRESLLQSHPDLFSKNEIPNNEQKFLDHCASLFETPRVFDRFKDKTWESWHTLHGQVCIDDLLVFNTLMYCCPSAFIELVRDKSVDNMFYSPFDNYLPPDDKKRVADEAPPEEKKSNKMRAEEELIGYFTDCEPSLNDRSISPQSLRYQGANDKQKYFKILIRGFPENDVKDQDYVDLISVKPEELEQAEQARISEWLSSDNLAKLAVFIAWQHKDTPEIVVNWLIKLVVLSPKNKVFTRDEYFKIWHVYDIIEKDFGFNHPHLHANMLNALSKIDPMFFLAYFRFCGVQASEKKARAIGDLVDLAEISKKLNSMLRGSDNTFEDIIPLSTVLQDIEKFKMLTSDEDVKRKFDVLKDSLNFDSNSNQANVVEIKVTSP